MSIENEDGRKGIRGVYIPVAKDLALPMLYVAEGFGKAGGWILQAVGAFAEEIGCGSV